MERAKESHLTRKKPFLSRFLRVTRAPSAGRPWGELGSPDEGEAALPNRAEAPGADSLAHARSPLAAGGDTHLETAMAGAGGSELPGSYTPRRSGARFPGRAAQAQAVGRRAAGGAACSDRHGPSGMDRPPDLVSQRHQGPTHGRRRRRSDPHHFKPGAPSPALC